MPNVASPIEYLQNLPLYEKEKPYWCLLTPRDGFDPDKHRLDSLEFEIRRDITIRDIRTAEEDLSIEKCGIQVLSHETKILSFEDVTDVDAYKAETEELLKEQLGAVFVKNYEFQSRKNVSIERNTFNILDPLLVEGPARGAHNIDVTFGSGPAIINRYLSPEEKGEYLKPGYRYCIFNTWRSLIWGLEDRPLALCDGRTVNSLDLVAAGRVILDRVGGVYYLRYNKNHHWYWLSKQTPLESYIFIMYDTAPGHNARYCPHVSFINPDAGQRCSIPPKCRDKILGDQQAVGETQSHGEAFQKLGEIEAVKMS